MRPAGVLLALLQPSLGITSSLFGQRTSVDQPRAVQVPFQFDF